MNWPLKMTSATTKSMRMKKREARLNLRKKVRTNCLLKVRQQLELLQTQFQNMGHSNSRPKSSEESSGSQPSQNEEFPALVPNPKQDKEQDKAIQISSWRDKVSSPKPQLGIPLKYVPPLIENGKLIVQI